MFQLWPDRIQHYVNPYREKESKTKPKSASHMHTRTITMYAAVCTCLVYGQLLTARLTDTIRGLIWHHKETPT